jgi:hypothetical protein
MGSNPIPFYVNQIFQNNKTIKVEYSYDIETINYKNKNPQAYLMGSNPTPALDFSTDK